MRGLKADDFLVQEDGKPRPIVFFREESQEPIALSVLIDTGSNMSYEGILAAKDLFFRLIHRLRRKDQIQVATYAKDVHFLSSLTSDRYKLLEAWRNISPGGRPAKITRLGNLFVSTSNTGYAVDEALSRMKTSNTNEKIVMVISAGFGNLGEATQDHLELAGARFFAVSANNTLGDIFNLGGDQKARKRIVEHSGGLSFDLADTEEEVVRLAASMTDFYLIAYSPTELGRDLEKRDVSFQVPRHPQFSLHVARRSHGSSSFY